MFWQDVSKLIQRALDINIRLAATRENQGCVLLCKMDYEYKQINKGGYVFGSVGLLVCLWITLLKKL